MLPGVNPRQMQKMMKRMGMQQSEIEAEEVIIKLTDGNDIIIRPANVVKVNMMGQQTFQITGEEHLQERDSSPEISEDDVNTVMEQTGKDKDTVMAAIEKHKGDLAEAILELQTEE